MSDKPKITKETIALDHLATAHYKSISKLQQSSHFGINPKGSKTATLSTGHLKEIKPIKNSPPDKPKK